MNPSVLSTLRYYQCRYLHCSFRHQLLNAFTMQPLSGLVFAGRTEFTSCLGKYSFRKVDFIAFDPRLLAKTFEHPLLGRLQLGIPWWSWVLPIAASFVAPIHCVSRPFLLHMEHSHRWGSDAMERSRACCNGRARANRRQDKYALRIGGSSISFRRLRRRSRNTKRVRNGFSAKMALIVDGFTSVRSETHLFEALRHLAIAPDCFWIGGSDNFRFTSSAIYDPPPTILFSLGNSAVDKSGRTTCFTKEAGF